MRGGLVSKVMVPLLELSLLPGCATYRKSFDPKVKIDAYENREEEVDKKNDEKYERALHLGAALYLFLN